MNVIKCDKCGCDIPTVTKIIFGVETEVLDRGVIKCEEWDIDPLIRYAKVDLCKPCALALSKDLDYNLLKMKIEFLKEMK